MVDQRTVLDEALARGIISDDQRRQMADLTSEERTDNEERIKPVGTLNEIFVTFGVILLTNAISGLIGLAFKGDGSDGMDTRAVIAAGGLGAGATWLVGLWFHQRRRFRLPIIYCVISVAITVGMVVFAGLSGDSFRDIYNNEVPVEIVLAAMGASMAVLAAGAARFRIPFLMLPIAILFTSIVSYAASHGEGDPSWRLLLGGCGLAILAVAITFDLKDPRRITRWSDFAFWSYVVGSPLFVHSLFLTVLLQDDFKRWMDNPIVWMSVAAMTIAVTFVGLLLNRRALILSTLIYVSLVIARIMASLSLGAPMTIGLVTTLLIGLYVTALGSRWARVRRYVMERQPKSWTWMNRLPPY